MGWSKDQKWAERSKCEDEEQRKSVRAALARTLLTETDKSLAAIIELRDNPDTPPGAAIAVSTPISTPEQGERGVTPVDMGGCRDSHPRPS